MKTTWWRVHPRIELAVSVAITAASIVGLSRVIHPDPSKLRHPSATMATRPFEARAEEPFEHPDPLPPPKVSPDFAAAVSRGDLATMAKMLTPGMPLDQMLATAAAAGEKDAALWLLDHGADVHEDESSRDAPILEADRHPEVVLLLLARGANEPPLAMAASAGAPNAVARLLAKRAVVNPGDASPLLEAVSSTRADPTVRMAIVETLLAAGAEPNHIHVSMGETGPYGPLTAAVRMCDAAQPEACLPMIKLLVRHGARADGETLSAALSVDDYGHGSILDAVLATRLVPGATAVALASAELEGRPRLVARLVAKGVDWAWHDGEEGAALPLLAAVRRRDQQGVRALLAAGAPVNQRSKDGGCALGIALDALGDDAESARMVELLLAHGADVNRRLPDGRTPLFAAAEAGQLRVINELLDRGARVNDVVLDDSAVDIADQKGNIAAARVLHARGGRRVRIVYPRY